ncbi:MAG: phospholipase D-like domain-containing protein [Verrucomicrobiota bacterium]|nr:phospholipase D-like domain-containing protein [Verrucomicrobiota bacterium]
MTKQSQTGSVSASVVLAGRPSAFWHRCVLAMACALFATARPRGQAWAGEKPVETPVAVTSAFGADCEKLVIEALKTAKSEILVAVYNFTQRNVSQALVEAAARKVKVIVKYDARSMKELPGMTQTIGYLRNRGVTCAGVTMRREYGKMHHKFAVVDGRTVVTGSWNYTFTAAKENYENVVRIVSADVARAFSREFEQIRDR